MANYQVTAPCVQIPDKKGSWSHFYQGAVIPAGFNDDRCKQLVDEKMLEVVSDAEPATKPATVEEILEQVGDDKELAAVALEEEKAGKNRQTLVKRLEAVAGSEPATE